MKYVMIDLMEEIERGQLSFRQIAAKFDVPLSWVDLANGELLQQYADELNDNWYDEQYELND